MKKAYLSITVLAIFLSSCAAVVSPSTTAPAPGNIEPDYAMNLILDNVQNYGDFRDADTDAVSAIQTACKDISSRVIGKVSDSGVEIYLVARNSDIDKDPSENEAVQQAAKQRAGALGRKYEVTSIVNLSAIVIAGSDDACKDIGQICDDVFIGQIH